MKNKNLPVGWVLNPPSFSVIFICLLMIICFACSIHASDFNVKDFHAAGDGCTPDGPAINNAITACANAGGGRVIVPAGTYYTATIYMKSNVTLELAKDAVLKFSDNPEDYPIIPLRHEGIEQFGFTAPLYAKDQSNFAIVGAGTIDGQGQKWWAHFLEAQERKNDPQSDLEKKLADLNKDKLRRSCGWFFPRPCLIEFYNCSNILLEGFTTKNSPMWTIHPVYCRNIVGRNLNITGGEDEPNTDGFNPDSCQNVLIEQCTFATGDDCVTIKSGYNEDGRRVGIACENITVRNCTMHHGHGGVVIGSETAGGVRNVTVEDCIMIGTDRGIRIKSARGRGGIVENIRVNNVKMKDIVQEPFRVNTFYGQKKGDRSIVPVSDATPIFRNIRFSNITCKGAANAASIRGLPEMPIQNITLENINIHAQGSFDCSDTQSLHLINTTITTDTGPALAISYNTDLTIDTFTCEKAQPSTPIISLLNTTDSRITHTTAPKETDIFLQIAGPQSANIQLENNNTQNVKTPIQFTDGATEQAVLKK